MPCAVRAVHDRLPESGARREERPVHSLHRDAFLQRGDVRRVDIVERMRAGRSPQEACEDGLDMIRRRYEKVNQAFMPGEKFIALSRDGDYGCAWSYEGRGAPRMSVRDEAGLEIYEGVRFGG